MYTLEAILARYTTLEGAMGDLSSVKLIRLPQGIGMIPIVGAVLQELELRYQDGTKVTDPDIQQFSQSVHPDFERLIVGVEKLAQQLSLHGTIAYVEATFSEGIGGHATMIWENGQRIGQPGSDINIVLQSLGVVPSPGLDEFYTIGLGRHRTTKQWLAESAG